MDLNATQAAIRAGYSARTAEQQGPRLLGNVEIAERVRILQEQRAARTGITADRVLQELALLGFSDVLHYLVDDFGRLTIAADVPGAVSRAVASVKHRSRTDEDGAVTHEVEYRLWDKPAALRLMAQHLGMLVERHEVTGKGGAPIAYAIQNAAGQIVEQG